uniref:Ig-like domain-containing protein n=1 Tax=Oreochromis aureus TaxID=47969 RepID=A0AAZ1XI38_OREAU
VIILSPLPPTPHLRKPSYRSSILEKISGSSVKPSPNLPVEGTSVSLTCEASGSVFTRKWMKDGSELTPTDNMTLSDSNRVLTFNTVNRKDNGEYFCQISNPVSTDEAKYIMTVNCNDPVKLSIKKKGYLTLKTVNVTQNKVKSCDVSKGTSSSYQWFNGSSMITANEHLQLSSGNSILTIRNVTRYDQGPYKCNVSNNVSNDISAPVNLNINYGPSNAKMTVMPVSSIYKGGSNITLSCSADSSPPAMITWMIDGVYQTNTSSIELQDATESDSGNYTCLIQNTVTLRFSSKTTAIQIVDWRPVQGVPCFFPYHI